MLVNEYVKTEEVNIKQFTALFNLIEKEKAESDTAKNNCLVGDAKRMLKNWGATNSYSSKCGYKNVSSMFSSLYPTFTKIIIENEIEFIETALLELKNSNDKKKQEQYKVAELYYKGFDVVDCGCDWSERLTTRDIADYLNMPKSTVFDRVKAVESYIAAEISRCHINSFI